MNTASRWNIRLGGALLGLAFFSAASAGSVSDGEWTLYKQKFLDPAGRIVDNANAGISHSEGQGYGLLLSYLADSHGDFDSIWAFTRREMLVRNDGLAVWKWNPAAEPHVSDINNATDGDLLIAYSLALAGKAWSRPDLTQAATAMARQLVASATMTVGKVTFFKPAITGFGAGDRPDGPVVNPSYWVFEAIPALAELVPDERWKALAKGGRVLLMQSARIGEAGLPPDWVSLKARPAPASGFPAEFGYNALRIPLYLLRAGIGDAAMLEPYRAHMADADGNVRIVEIDTGKTRQVLADPGYRIIAALVACALDGTALPRDTLAFEPKDYYASTLQLLSLSYARLKHPECL